MEQKEMELPKLPTDNLYKFMALSGLVILVLSFAPFYFSHKIAIEIIRLEGEIERYEGKRKSLITKGEKVIEELEKLKANKSVNQIDKKLEDIKRLEPKFFENVDEILLTKIELNVRIKQVGERLRMNNYLKAICPISSIIGSFLTFFGFIFWYTKLQQYQDRIIKEQADGT